MGPDRLDDSPYVFSRMAELAACNAGTETPVANTDRVVLEVIREVVIALGHGPDENSNAFVLVQSVDVVPYANNFGFEAERNLAAIRRKVVCDGILNDLDELFLGGSRPDLMSVEKLDH